ncbi:hypothetical protein BJX99DRAFT_258625 [Aspergillus californicus]
MDPLSILGAVSAVMGIVEIGSTLVSTGLSRYTQARELTKDQQAIVADTNDIKERAQVLRDSLDIDEALKGLTSSHQVKLRKLCEDSLRVTEELLALLERWRASRRTGVVGNVKAVVGTRSSLSAGRIKKMEGKLKDLQTRSSEVLILILNDKQSKSISMVASLSHEIASMKLHVTTSIDTLRNDVLMAAATSKKASTLGLEHTYRLLERFTAEIESKRAQVKITKSLRYTNMRQRFHNVVGAMQNTFRWIYEGVPDDDIPPVEFNSWLHSGSGVYWITGHPGSGKSTLMKFIHENGRTRRALAHWAGSKQLVVASHFFWIQGSAMQRSQEGLLAGLLENILTQCPELVSVVATAVWSGSSPWSFQDLQAAYKLLASQTSFPVRFCFLIDALDEYEGDHNAVAEIVKTLAENPDIKICVSSREWNVFTYHFGSIDPKQKLRLQEYTREDIKTFIRSTLENDQRFRDFEQAQTEQTLDDEHAYSTADLAVDICSFAQGVFLWVFLVCRELVKGLTNEDTMEFLKARLHDLPHELDEYFRRMLDNVDKVYHARNSQILQVLSVARGPVPLSFMAHLDREGNFALLSELHAPVESEQTQESRLRAHGGDLVTIDDSLDEKGRHVTLLHRTVSDFLMRGDMKQLLLDRLQRPFDPVVYLANATVTAVENFVPANSVIDRDSLDFLLLEFLWYTRLAEKRKSPMHVQLLDKMERLFCDLALKLKHKERISEKYKLQYSSNWMFQLAVLCGLKSYLAAWLEKDPGLASAGASASNNGHPPPLHIALQTVDAILFLELDSIFPQADPEIIALLLAYGAQPNQEWESMSIWHRFLRRIHTHKPDFGLDDADFMVLIRGFLEAGADLSTAVVVGTTTQGGGVGAGRHYLVKKAPEAIIATCCSPDEMRVLVAQYARTGIVRQVLQGIGWV